MRKSLLKGLVSLLMAGFFTYPQTAGTAPQPRGIGLSQTTPDEIPACPKEKPELFSSGRTNVMPASRKSGSIFVARSAQVWVESKGGTFRVWAEHNFVTGQKKFHCVDWPKDPQITKKNLSVPLLVLDDSSPTQKYGNSVWNFQLMMDHDRVGLWNEQSDLMTSSPFVRQDILTRSQLLVIDADRFRRVDTTDDGKMTWASVIDYDDGRDLE